MTKQPLHATWLCVIRLLKSCRLEWDKRTPVAAERNTYVPQIEIPLDQLERSDDHGGSGPVISLADNNFGGTECPGWRPNGRWTPMTVRLLDDLEGRIIHSLCPGEASHAFWNKLGKTRGMDFVSRSVNSNTIIGSPGEMSVLC